jgi:TonB-linked SusC/RagA family outer membrane protein
VVSDGSKTEVGYSGYYGVNMAKLADLMDGDTYVQLRRDRARWSNYSWTDWETGGALTDAQVFSSQEIETVNNRNYVDWASLLYRNTSSTQEHSLYVDHNTADTKVRFSSSYRKESGYYENNDFSRLTLGLKVDQKLLSFLDLNVNVRYSNQSTDNVDPGEMGISASQSQNIFRYINPLVQAYDANGNLIEEVLSPYANPLLDLVNKPTNRNTTNKLFGILNLKAKIFDGLTFTSTFGYDVNFGASDLFYPKNSAKRYMVRESLGAYASRYKGRNQKFTFDNYFNYSNMFGKHAIDATLVSSIQSDTADDISMEGSMLPDDVLEYWNMRQFTMNKDIANYYMKQTLTSFIGRFQYTYDDKYMANFSLRRDGSSVLSPGYKWGTFPAASLAWIISNEDFFSTNVVSKLKLRGSYGSLGSATISPYQSFGSIYPIRTNFGNEMVTGYTLADITGTTRSITNKALTWETSTTLNVGVDWALFNNRISGYVEWYKTKTSDLIFSAKLPIHSGFTQTMENVGATINKGIEVNLSSVNINNKSFRWTTDINFSHNKSYIESLKGGEDMVNDRLFIGEPWRIVYDNVWTGIWQINDPDLANYVNGTATNPGKLKYKDITGEDGEPDGVVNELDRVILGVLDPKFIGFMRNTVDYKKFSLSVGILGRFGHIIGMSGRGWETSTWPLAIAKDYWTPDNPNGKYDFLDLTSAGNTGNSPAGVVRYRSGDYIRLQELSLSYHCSLVGLKDVRLGVISNNPAYLWKKAKDCLDPSTGGNGTWTTFSSVVFKLDVKF